MPQVSFPIFALTDKTNFGELPALFANAVKHLTAQKQPNTMLLFEVCDAPDWVHDTVKPVATPDRMVIMVYQPAAREAIARAIIAAKQREPQVTPTKKLHLVAKPNTPLRSIFKQMAEIPLSEFNVTDAKTPGATLFFLRSETMIAEFRKELPNVVIA